MFGDFPLTFPFVSKTWTYVEYLYNKLKFFQTVSTVLLFVDYLLLDE